MIINEQRCPLCDGGEKPVKQLGEVIVCPMCYDKYKVTHEDKKAFFYKLMQKKAMYYVK